MEILLKLMQSKDNEVQLNAAGALSTLSGDEDVANEVRKCKGFDVIAELLKSEDEELLERVIGSLWNLGMIGMILV